MPTSFMENLRKPKKLPRWAPTGEIRAGESDPYNWAKDLIERERNDDMTGGFAPMRRGNMSRVGASIGSSANPNYNRAGFDPAKTYQNTVYNQAPEMATKQLNLQKQEMASRDKAMEAKRIVDALAANDDFIDNRRQNEMKSRGMDNEMDIAKQKLAMQIGDREKLDIENAARMAQIQAQGGNAREIAELNNTRAREIADENNRRAAEVAAGNNKATVTAAEARAGNRSNDPKDAAQTTQNKLAQLFLDPEFATAIEQTDKGFAINDAIDDDLRRRLSNRLYARTGDINIGGVGSAALGGSLAGMPITGNGQDPSVTNNATPSSGNASPNTQGSVMRKTQRNVKTGATRVLVSRDGGATWQPE